MSNKVATAILEIKTDTSKSRDDLGLLGKKGEELGATMKKVTSSMSASFSDFGGHVKSVQKFTNEFSGQKAIQEAHAIAKAVQEIGGAQNLTAQQQKRVSSVMESALVAHKKRGDEAAASIRGLAAATKQAETPTASWTAHLTKANAILGAFGVTMGATAIVGFGKKILDDLGAIEDLHQATGVTRTGLQQLGSVGSEVGVDMNEMGTAVSNLSKRLAGGDAGAVASVEGLGLSVKKLIAAGPLEAFLQVSEGASHIENPMTKADVAASLFGDKLGTRLIPLLGDLRQKMEEVPKGDLFSDQDIQDADAFGDAIGHITTKLEAYAVRAARYLANSAHSGPTAESRLNLYGPERFAAQTAGQDIPLPTTAFQGPVLTQTDILANRLTALRSQAVEPLTAAQKANIAELQKWGIAEKEIATLVVASDTAVHKYVEQIKKGEEFAKNWEKANKAVVAAIDGHGSALDTLSAGYRRVIADALKGGASVEEIATAWNLEKEQVEAVAAAMKLHDEILKIESGDLRAQGDALEKLGTRQDREIELLNQSREARERMNSSRVLDIDMLRSLGQMEDFEIQRLLKLTKIYTDWTKLEREGFQRGANGLEDVGLPAQPLSQQQQQDLDKWNRQREQTKQGLQDLSQAFAHVAQVAGGSFSGVAKGIGEAVTAINLANTAMSNLDKAVAAGTANWASYASAAAGVASAVAVGVGALYTYIHNSNEQMRRLQESQAETAKGLSDRYNDLRAAIPVDAANKLVQQILDLQKLTLDDSIEGMRRYRDAVKAIEDELSHFEDIRSGAEAFGLSHSQLVEAEKRAHEIFDYMVKEGGYTKEQLDAAYYAWQKAMADAGNEAAKAWVKAADAAKGATGDASDAMSALEHDLNDMIEHRGEVQKRVDAEAAEDEMGINEKNDRAELAALDVKLREKADEYARLAQETGKTMAEEIVKALRDLHIDPVHVPTVVDPPRTPDLRNGFPGPGDAHTNNDLPVPGGEVDFTPAARGLYGRLRKPRVFLGGEAGNEDVVFGGAGRNLASDIAAELARINGSGSGEPTVVESHSHLYLDSQHVTTKVVRNIVHDVRGAGTTLRGVLQPRAKVNA